MRLQLVTVFLFMTTLCCIGQIRENKTDSSKAITSMGFDALVDHSTELLKTKGLNSISDGDHVHIMRCLNTIFMTRDSHGKKIFSGGRYSKLETLTKETDYARKIIKIYPDWIPNRGMGFYFKKLNWNFMEHQVNVPYLEWRNKRRRQQKPIKHTPYCRFLKDVLLNFVSNVGQGRIHTLTIIA